VYERARVERGGFLVEVCANRALDKALQPRPQAVQMPGPGMPNSRGRSLAQETLVMPSAPDPLARLHTLASEVASAMEFMAARFGPPALPHLTVSPIPGAFGQGFPGLVYLSTLSYLKRVPQSRNEAQELFFTDLLQAHEAAHQWWGNRVTAATYRDNWVMEALANYSALLYLEKSKGEHSIDTMLDYYRDSLLDKNEAGATVESAGPIALGPRLESSQEPRAWRAIVYGKGSWIIHMLRQRLGDQAFFALLADILKRYDHKEMSTEEFRAAAASFLPPKSEDPKLEAFFDQWVYGTGVPTLKVSYTLKGKAPALRLVGTLTQTDTDQDFSALTPVEIQIARGRTQTVWVASSSSPVTFTVPLKAAPLKVTLDPHRAVLRR
jgi:hypothetical protein